MAFDLPAVKRRMELARMAEATAHPPFRAALIAASAKDVPALVREVERLNQLLSGVRADAVSLATDALAISQGRDLSAAVGEG